jgi:hypothetical protein
VKVWRIGYEYSKFQMNNKHARGEKPKKANSPEKDPEETAQESSDPCKKKLRNPRKESADLRKLDLKRKKSRSKDKKSTPVNAGWNLLADAGAEQLEKLSKKPKSGKKKKHHVDTLCPVDQVQPKSYIG